MFRVTRATKEILEQKEIKMIQEKIVNAIYRYGETEN